MASQQQAQQEQRQERPRPPAASAIGEPLPACCECLYFDYNATTPVYPEVARALAAAPWGNPSSGHANGRAAAATVAAAREAVARLIRAASPDEVKFVGCGTEADNWAIYGAVMAARARAGGGNGAPPPHVVATAIEHPAVIECLRALSEAGLCTHTLVGVGPDGVVDAAAVAAAVRPGETCLVTVMHSNNETGALQPVAEVAARVRAVCRGGSSSNTDGGSSSNTDGGRSGSGNATTAAPAAACLIHTDAAQSAGKVSLDVEALGVDLMTVVGHKFGAPKGIGALYVRDGARIANLLHGGGQERGARAGTESVALIAALGAAAALATDEQPRLAAHMAATRDALRDRLVAAFGGAARVNGPAADASKLLPNTLSLSVRGLDAAALLGALSERLAASAAAACHSGAAGSPVLAAMGVPAEWARGTLRLSTGRHTTMGEVEAAAKLLIEAAAVQGVQCVV